MAKSNRGNRTARTVVLVSVLGSLSALSGCRRTSQPVAAMGSASNAPNGAAITTASTGEALAGGQPSTPRPQASSEAADGVPTRHEEWRFATRYPESERIEPGRWLHRHGVTGAVLREPCWDLGEQVGVPKAPGLLCLSVKQSPPESIATVYRVHSRRLEQVWHATVATWANWLELTPVLSSDGAVLELRDRTPRACEYALKEYRAKSRSGVRPGFGEALARGCSAVGPFDWEGRRYVKRPAVTSDAGGQRDRTELDFVE